MYKLDRNKKAFLLLATYFIILFTPKFKRNQNSITYNDNYHITDDSEFATYEDYHIYIGSEEYISKISNDGINNIYIIDGRNDDNPNFEICNSFRISNAKQRQEILKILLEYESRYPTKWHRTIKSMGNEWMIHNICYRLGIETNRTSKIDLDNNDEENYQNIIAILNTLINDDFYEKETDTLTKKLTK